MAQIEHQTLTISPKQAFGFVTSCVEAGLVPYLAGSPAIGKSAIAKKVAKAGNLLLIDMRLSQCDPTDLNGFPRMDGDKATYLPMDTFPLSADALPMDDAGKPMNGWLLFFDELPAASKAVQAAAYKILLDRMVGKYHLHENVYMMAAGNLTTDNAVAFELSTALRSRMIHAQLEANIQDWLAWATDPSQGDIHHYVTSFLNFKSGSLYNFDPDSPISTYASPRTWEFASKLLKGGCDPTTPEGYALMMGTIGITASEFQAFVKNFGNIPLLTDIVANPMTVDVPTAPGTLYALCGSMSAWFDMQNGDKLFQYTSRLPQEYQVITLRDALKRNPNVRNIPAMRTWIQANYKSLTA